MRFIAIFISVFVVAGPANATEDFDMKAGGTPERGTHILQAELGFSALPALSYAYAILDQFTLGARFTFDDAGDAPANVFTPSLLFQAPMRFSAYRKNAFTVGVHFDPGFGVTFPAAQAFVADQALVDILLEAGANAAYHVNIVAIGGGLDMPVAVSVVTQTNAVVLHWPLLVGPILEIYPRANLALTLDAKFGVLLADPGTATFAMKLLAGVAYHF